MPPCDDHRHLIDTLAELTKGQTVMQKDIEYLRRDQETILARFGKHMEEAERDGGWHPRIVSIEQEIRNIKERRTYDTIIQRWFMVGAGFIGGMMGAGAPEAFLGIVRAMGIIK